MEREKDLQAKYASLRDELEELKRSLQMVAINNDVGQSNSHTTERTVEEDQERLCILFLVLKIFQKDGKIKYKIKTMELKNIVLNQIPNFSDENQGFDLIALWSTDTVKIIVGTRPLSILEHFI